VDVCAGGASFVLRSRSCADKEGVQGAISTTVRDPSLASNSGTDGADRTRASGEEGFTGVELLVVISIALVLIAGVTGFIVVSLRQANRVTSRTVAARQAEVFLARLTREVRAAQYIESSTNGSNTTPVNVTYGEGSSSATFYLPVAGSTGKGTQVTWTCTAKASCTRTLAGGSAVTFLKGVESATFTPLGSSGVQLASGAGAASSPSYPSSIRITLSVKQISQADRSQTQTVGTSASPILVQDGVNLRNYS
jgi:type II secretory pathway pseudopilin PulG